MRNLTWRVRLGFVLMMFCASLLLLFPCVLLAQSGAPPLISIQVSPGSNYIYGCCDNHLWPSLNFQVKDITVSSSATSSTATVSLHVETSDSNPYGWADVTSSGGFDVNVRGTSGDPYRLTWSCTGAIEADGYIPGSNLPTVALFGCGTLGAQGNFNLTSHDSGVINGTLSGGNPGDYHYATSFGHTISMDQGGHRSADWIVSVTVTIMSNQPLTLSCPSSAATVDVYYTSSLGASGGLPPYTFSLSSGGLPPGTLLDSSSGSITGTPLVGGNFAFTAQVQDSLGSTVTQSCLIDVGGGQCSPPLATSTTLSADNGSTDKCIQVGDITTDGCGRAGNDLRPWLRRAVEILALTNPAAAQAASCLDKNNPACGVNTAFSNFPTLGSKKANGPCDLHDYCYATCWATDPIALKTEDHKENCDDFFDSDLNGVCLHAEALGQDPQPVIDACYFFAHAYAFAVAGIPIVSGSIYAADQRQACLCCPDGSDDGNIGPNGGIVTDDLFGAQAQVTAPSGVLAVPTAVSIDVLPTSLNVSVPQGFSPATYFTTIGLVPHPIALPSPGMSVVLPLATSVVPGAKLVLYRVDSTNALVPVPSVGGGYVSGIADSQGFTATFTGVATFSTIVGLFMPGDVNGDLKVDCSDLALIKAAFGKTSGQAGFDARADVNFDGVVNVKDLAFVAQHLPAGTHCP
jgi:hypothetical protein